MQVGQELVLVIEDTLAAQPNSVDATGLWPKLQTNGVTIGSAPSCDVVLDDPDVPALAAVIAYGSNHFLRYNSGDFKAGACGRVEGQKMRFGRFIVILGPV
jgi:hypothetical protein